MDLPDSGLQVGMLMLCSPSTSSLDAEKLTETTVFEHCFHRQV